MDQLQDLGSVIPEILGPTYAIYGDLLRQPEVAAAIYKTKREEYSYGPDPRQKLDLYSPSQNNSTSRSRVLIFVYGGGFFSGEKRLSDTLGDEAYANIGHFFVEQFGFETVVMDYRLTGHGATYPSGAEDVDLCLRWVAERFGQQSDTFILANSAGAAHVTSWMFGDKWADGRSGFFDGLRGPKLQAVGLLGCSFRLDPDGDMKPLLKAYYGTPENTRLSEPTSLMLQAAKIVSRSEVAKWPRIMTIVSELDPKEHIIDTGREFATLWEAKGGRGAFVEIMGHNHISPVLSLGTGIAAEEAWGRDFGNWLIEG
ncbi:hypothetical protein H2200_001043 [Cladophialophora chaetospira]|uniref:BD-FAE-like domain-containing protein n=1 Tax=Cladophialophora chaetospira TaxID=386627 RepID=A0AA38XK45_9EURO|nr:hypothetical protein H2200_001043 [Cladophialophora chaetospira]